MAQKMYYNEDEAKQQLGIDDEKLEQLIRDGRLRVYQDGQKRMFRAQDVDGMTQSSEDSTAGGDEVELSPADSTGGVDLSEDTSAGGGKEDTVITSEGISVFDEEDLDVESADPMAKTQVSASLEDQQNLENVGTGSGLLDLTRESDDTSLDAEVLGQIDMEDTSGAQGVGSSIGESVEEPQPQQPAPAAAAQQQQPVAMAPDATAGLFAGLLGGIAILAVLLMAVTMAEMVRGLPGYIEYMKDNMMLVMSVAVVVLLIAAVIGYFVNKSAAGARRA